MIQQSKKLYYVCMYENNLFFKVDINTNQAVVQDVWTPCQCTASQVYFVWESRQIAKYHQKGEAPV